MYVISWFWPKGDLLKEGQLMMGDPYSVNSPRRVLSLSRRRNETPSISKFDKGQEFGSSGEHGPKPSEVYGFVGAITTVVATGMLHLHC